ncbi:MAG: 4-hydroxy-tetrahydrodipicolinate synthase [Candidatus Kapabacteria bacterium]|nr:4-hydroxy-tetrahydrodipicolinate synthase [Candidatus Kapabacteria bacterium]
MKPFGLFTAVVTPMRPDGSVDVDCFRTLLEHQVAAGVDGVVVCGSTGEGATLRTDEKLHLFDIALQTFGSHGTVIAGTGSNDTASTIALSRQAAGLGVHGLLLVTPYYNKPTQQGIVAHHRAVADAVDVPQILYNVPGRTGTNMTAETQLAIASACPNVVATKEASANLEQISDIAGQAPEHFSVLAGDDSLALPSIACGARGVIAVISNYAPVRYRRLIHAALQGDLATARSEQAHLMPWFKANFLESNPGPVKYIMHRLHGSELTMRLPMVPVGGSTRAALDAMLQGFADA